MKKIYESFEEIADDFTNGEYLVHQLADHSTELCYVWSTAIHEFAKALDLAGIKLMNNPEIYKKFWENVDDSLQEWKAGLNRRKPFSRKLGELTVEEAEQKYGMKMTVGHKLIIPEIDFNGEWSEDYYLIISNQ